MYKNAIKSCHKALIILESDIFNTIKETKETRSLRDNKDFKQKLMVVVNAYYTLAMAREKIHQQDVKDLKSDQMTLEKPFLKNGYKLSKAFLGSSHPFTLKFKIKLTSEEALLEKDQKSPSVTHNNTPSNRPSSSSKSSSLNVSLLAPSHADSDSPKKSLRRALETKPIGEFAELKQEESTPTASRRGDSQPRSFIIKNNSSGNVRQRSFSGSLEQASNVREATRKYYLNFISSDTTKNRLPESKRIEQTQSKRRGSRSLIIPQVEKEVEGLAQGQLHISKNLELILRSQLEFEEKINKQIEQTVLKSRTNQKPPTALTELQLQVETLKKENELMQKNKIDKEIEAEQLRLQLNMLQRSMSQGSIPQPFFPPYYPYVGTPMSYGPGQFYPNSNMPQYYNFPIPSPNVSQPSANFIQSDNSLDSNSIMSRRKRSSSNNSRMTVTFTPNTQTNLQINKSKADDSSAINPESGSGDSKPDVEETKPILVLKVPDSTTGESKTAPEKETAGVIILKAPSGEKIEVNLTTNLSPDTKADVSAVSKPNRRVGKYSDPKSRKFELDFSKLSQKPKTEEKPSSQMPPPVQSQASVKQKPSLMHLSSIQMEVKANLQSPNNLKPEFNPSRTHLTVSTSNTISTVFSSNNLKNSKLDLSITKTESEMQPGSVQNIQNTSVASENKLFSPTLPTTKEVNQSK